MWEKISSNWCLITCCDGVGTKRTKTVFSVDLGMVLPVLPVSGDRPYSTRKEKMAWKRYRILLLSLLFLKILAYTFPFSVASKRRNQLSDAGWTRLAVTRLFFFGWIWLLRFCKRCHKYFLSALPPSKYEIPPTCYFQLLTWNAAYFCTEMELKAWQHVYNPLTYLYQLFIAQRKQSRLPTASLLSSPLLAERIYIT